MPDTRQKRVVDLHPVLWLVLPLVTLGLCWLMPVITADPRHWQMMVEGEGSFLEIATVLLLIPAVVVSVLIFLRRRQLPRGVGWLMLLWGAGALYFGGEEISWGQHVLHFRTPGFLDKINRQHEFNLHNIEGWNIFNNLPRQLLLVATLVGGIILPLVLRKRLAGPEAPKGRLYWLVPTWRLVPVSLMAALSTVPEKLFKPALVAAGGRDTYVYRAFIEPGGELKEYGFALVMLMYLLSIYLRMGPKGAAAEA